MKAKDVMTTEPACCYPSTSIQEVARLMKQFDCGEIPVVDEKTRKPVGVITDRDIACRCVADGKDTRQVTAEDCMSKPVITVTPDADLEECCTAMEKNQIRRIPVVDSDGCCGIVSQADIARTSSAKQVASVVKIVSRPTPSASRL
jgi:CBS domain-containing protein